MFDSAVGVNVGSVECARKQRQEHAENDEEVGPRALWSHRAQAGMHKPNIPQMLRGRASTRKPEAAAGRSPTPLPAAKSGAFSQITRRPGYAA